MDRIKLILKEFYDMTGITVILAERLGKRISFIAGYGCEYLDPGASWKTVELGDNLVVYIEDEGDPRLIDLERELMRLWLHGGRA